MKRTLITSTLFIIVLMLCTFAFFACTPKEQSVSIVITGVERDAESDVLYIEGYSISDKKEFRFKFQDTVAPGDEPLISNVVEITYEAETENEEAIPIASINVLSNEVFAGKMVFIKGLGACFISYVNNVYTLNEIKGLNDAYYDTLKPADNVVIYGDVISENKNIITIKASHLKIANDNKDTSFNKLELKLIENYDFVQSYAQTQYETPLGDRDPNDPETVALLAITDAKIKEEYGIDNREDYSVRIGEHASKPQKTVKYELYLFGYETYESYNITIDNNGTVLKYYASNEGEYSRFLPYLTVEKVQAAEEKLKTKLEKYGGGSGMYLQIINQNQLCLSFEVIVDIAPPKSEIIDGEIVNGGCNIDHKHVFESEVICDLNE